MTYLDAGGLGKITIMIKGYFWAYLSMKKGMLDNDYYFYDDGKILHHYDQTMQKRDLEVYVTANDISESDKQKILEKCISECPEQIANRIKYILKNTKTNIK